MTRVIPSPDVVLDDRNRLEVVSKDWLYDLARRKSVISYSSNLWGGRTLNAGATGDVLVYKPRPTLTGTIDALTATTLTDNTPSWSSSDLASDVSKGSWTITVADATVFDVGMRVVIHESGKKSTIAVIISKNDSTGLIRLSVPTVDDYTTAGGAYLTENLKGRVLQPNVNSSKKFIIKDNTKTEIQVEDGDLTQFASVGDTYKVLYETAYVSRIVMTSTHKVYWWVYVQNKQTYDVEVLACTHVGDQIPLPYDVPIQLRGDKGDYIRVEAQDYQGVSPTVATSIHGWMEVEM